MIAAPSSDVERARKEIERVDRQLVTLIAERTRVAREIGRAKRAAGMTTLDPAREAAVVRRAGELARELGLDDEVVRRIFWQLIALSRSVQSE
jgi:chorismate mutase